MTARALLTTAATLSLVASVTACSSTAYTAAPTGAPPGTAHTKSVQALPSLAFTPATATIAVGDSVAFEFGSVAHDVYFDAANGAPANIPAATANATVARAFPTAGTYAYTCHIHPQMHGTVVVTAGG